MGRFVGDSDYSLEWPAEIFEGEVRRLIDRGLSFGTDVRWREEVETLLRQAFSSAVPRNDFENAAARRPGLAAGYGFDEEPF